MSADSLFLNVAVFSNREQDRVCLIHMDDPDCDRATAEAATSGYKFAGVLAVNAGVPKVSIEPGYEAAVAYAGCIFAEMLGEKLKRVQEGV